MEIAIKKLKGSDPREVEREFESLSKLKHKNIVTVYGIYIDTVDIHILLEYAECGSVYKFLGYCKTKIVLAKPSDVPCSRTLRFFVLIFYYFFSTCFLKKSEWREN